MLDKAIKNGKEKRIPYRGAKAVSGSCRNNRSCPYCRDGRLFNRKKTEEHSLLQLKEYWSSYVDDSYVTRKRS